MTRARAAAASRQGSRRATSGGVSKGVDSKRVGLLAGRLVTWFSAHQRDLPWRAEAAAPVAAAPGAAGSLVAEKAAAYAGGGRPRRDPYAVWVSEIMLQQTQVVTVVEYFKRWMARFPTGAALAGAEEAEVLALWAGLGYYSRARNLLVTARRVVAELGGNFPRSRADLLALKGIGDYTAGAICSLAFDQPEPILDGNLVRVFSRLYGLGFQPGSKAEKETYWNLARAWAESGRAALVNEGLMELGALVCTPRNPLCGTCPLAADCRARREGRQESLPPPKARKAGREVRGTALVALRGTDVVLYRPPKGELLAGLLTFPVFSAVDIPSLRKAWRERLPAQPVPAFKPRAAAVSHSITHHVFRLQLAEARFDAGAAAPELPEGYAWVPRAEVEKLLVSSLPKKIWKAFA